MEMLKEEIDRHKREKKVLKNFIKDFNRLKQYEDNYKKNIRESKPYKKSKIFIDIDDDMTEEDIKALRDGNEEYDRMIKNENIDNVLKDIEHIEGEDYLRYLNSKNPKYNKSIIGGRKKKTKKRRKTRRKRRKTRRKKRKKRQKIGRAHV